MKKIGIYTITNKINNKLYIGYTINFLKRKDDHLYLLRKGTHQNQCLQNSVNKYGVENFKVELLEECEELFLASQENYWCNMLCTHNRKYGYNLRSTNPNDTPKMSQETKDKIGKANSNKTWSLEQRKKLEIINKNNINRINATKLSGLKRRGIGKKVLQFTLDGRFIEEFTSCKNASVITLIDYSTIGKCCRKVINKAGGYIFKYKDNG